VGAVVGFFVGFCVIGYLYGRRERQQAEETATGPTQDEE
jgi:hypothetical protein